MSEVSVSLRITLDKANQDLKAAVANIRKELGGTSMNVGEKASKDMDKLTASTKKAVAEAKALNTEMKGVIRDVSGRSPSSMSGARLDQLAQLRMQRSQGLRGYNVQAFMRGEVSAPGMTAHEAAASAGAGMRSAATIKNPLLRKFDFFQGAPPVIPPPPKVAQSAASGVSFSRSGLSALSASGIPYVSTLARAVFSPLGAAAAASAVSLMAFRHAINEATSMYAKVLRSGGLPGGFVAKRSALASIIGVGEEEVIKYGTAIRYLNDKVAWSSKVIAETTNDLASLGWGFGVVGQDIKALVAQIISELAPMLRQVLDSLHEVLKFVGKWGSMLGKVIQEAMIIALKTAFSNSIIVGAIIDVFRGWKTDPGAAPTASVNMNQMPASAWERMGLIIGNDNVHSAAERTAKNTAGILAQLKTLNEKINDQRVMDRIFPHGLMNQY